MLSCFSCKRDGDTKLSIGAMRMAGSGDDFMWVDIAQSLNTNARSFENVSSQLAFEASLIHDEFDPWLVQFKPWILKMVDVSYRLRTAANAHH